mmetsp:Transcript_27654/g.56685  ORF Transcript_27654/g.56685 Transcript_27654/m.56685 type:complete len:229 (-) Transcript_27654:302-988(-)
MEPVGNDVAVFVQRRNVDADLCVDDLQVIEYTVRNDPAVLRRELEGRPGLELVDKNPRHRDALGRNTVCLHQYPPLRLHSTTFLNQVSVVQCEITEGCTVASDFHGVLLTAVRDEGTSRGIQFLRGVAPVTLPLQSDAAGDVQSVGGAKHPWAQDHCPTRYSLLLDALGGEFDGPLNCFRVISFPVPYGAEILGVGKGTRASTSLGHDLVKFFRIVSLKGARFRLRRR